MAETINILQTNDGIPLTDPVGSFIYAVKDGKDYFIAYEDYIKISNYRRVSAETCDGTEDQVITYSTPLNDPVRPVIDDYQGKGIEITAFDENGFTITSLGSGSFGYLVMPDV